MKRYIVFALAAPVVVWLGFIVIGKVRPDEAGTNVFTETGPLLNVPHGLLLESMAAGVLTAYLTS